MSQGVGVVGVADPHGAPTTGPEFALSPAELTALTT